MLTMPTESQGSRPARTLRLSAGALAVTALVSALLFGLYILAFYAGALATGEMTVWNDVLPRLYVPGSRLATAGIGVHFLLLGTYYFTTLYWGPAILRRLVG